MKTQINKKHFENLHESVRASVCLCNSAWGNEERNLFVFLSLFHPELTYEERIEIIRNNKKEEK